MLLSKLTKIFAAGTLMLCSATVTFSTCAPPANAQQQLVAMADPSAMVIICFRMSQRTTDVDKRAVMNYLSQQGLYEVGFKPNGYECTAQGTCADVMRMMKSQLYVAQLTLSNQMILAYRFDPLPTNPPDLKNKARYAYVSEAPGYASGSSSASFPNGQGGYNQNGGNGGYGNNAGYGNNGGYGNGEPPLNMYPGQSNQTGGQYTGGGRPYTGGGGQYAGGGGGQYAGGGGPQYAGGGGPQYAGGGPQYAGGGGPQYAGGGGSQFGNGGGGSGTGQPVQTSPFGNTTPAYNPNGQMVPVNNQNSQSAPPNLGPPIQGTAGPPI